MEFGVGYGLRRGDPLGKRQVTFGSHLGTGLREKRFSEWRIRGGYAFIDQIGDDSKRRGHQFQTITLSTKFPSFKLLLSTKFPA